MSELRIVVIYNGKWHNSGTSFVYKGGKPKGLFVSKKVTYNELLDRIYNLLMLNRDQASITMKFTYTSQISIEPLEIADDDDVRFFIGENSDSKTRTPLYISVQYRVLQVQQVSMVEPIHEQDHDHTFFPTDGSSQSMNFVPESLPQQLEQHDSFELNPGDNFETRVEFEHAQIGDQVIQHDLGDISRQTAANTVNISASSSFPSPNQQDVLFAKEMLSVGFMNPYEHEDLEMKQVFNDKKDLKKTLALIAMKKNFQFKVRKSTKELFLVTCVDKNCKWRIRAAKLMDSLQFMIRKYHKVHTCSSNIRRQRENPQGSSLFVTQYVKSKHESSPGVYKPKDIIVDVQREFGISLCYTQAWRCRKSALDCIEGSPTRTRKCGNCGAPGHIRRHCKEVVPVNSAVGSQTTTRKCGNCGAPGHIRRHCRELVPVQSSA